MKPARQITGILIAAFGIYLAWQGTRLRIEGDFGPGPGFFPFWIGLGLTAMAGLWSLRMAFGKTDTAVASILPPRKNLIVLVAVIGALIAFMLVLRPIGFNLAMLLLLLTLFFVLDRKHAGVKIGVAFIGSFGVHWAFETLLAVPLPDAEITFLRQLGL